MNDICAVHNGYISHKRSNPGTHGVPSPRPCSYRKSQQQLRSSLGCWLGSPEAGGCLSLAVVVRHQTPPCHLPPREPVYLSVGSSWPSYLPKGEREETTSSWSTGEHLWCVCLNPYTPQKEGKKTTAVEPAAAMWTRAGFPLPQPQALGQQSSQASSGSLFLTDSRPHCYPG